MDDVDNLDCKVLGVDVPDQMPFNFCSFATRLTAVFGFIMALMRAVQRSV